MAASQPRPTGSADPQMMLVPYRPGLSRKRTVRVAMILLLVATVFYAGGYWQGVRQNFHLRDQRAALGGQMSDLQKNLQQLQDENAVLRHGNEVERQASEQVRRENVQLQDKLSAMEQTLSLYKGILAPDAGEKGLRIERLELTQIPSNRFRFKLVLAQVADNAGLVSGTIRYNLLGQQDGKPATIPFEQLATDPSSEGTPFNFRFFQDVSGEFSLPDGFVPQQIEVIVQAKGRKTTKLERRFDWNVREVSNDVGKG